MEPMYLSTLEALVDKHGMTLVLSGLREICRLKAEHLESNWQDAVSAKVWERVGKAVNKAHDIANDYGV
jgi:hypothetical protein